MDEQVDNHHYSNVSDCVSHFPRSLIVKCL
jgi:hypothetical protein